MPLNCSLLNGSRVHCMLCILVVIYLRCQLDGAKGCPVNQQTIISGCACESISEEMSIWMVDRVKRSPSPMPVGIFQSTESLNRTERWRKSEFLLSSELGHPSSPPALALRPPASEYDLHHWLCWFAGLWAWPEVHHGLSWALSRQMADSGVCQQYIYMIFWLIQYFITIKKKHWNLKLR